MKETRALFTVFVHQRRGRRSRRYNALADACVCVCVCARDTHIEPKPQEAKNFSLALPMPSSPSILENDMNLTSESLGVFVLVFPDFRPPT